MDIFAVCLSTVVVKVEDEANSKASGFLGYVRWGLYGSRCPTSTEEALTADNMGSATAIGFRRRFIFLQFLSGVFSNCWRFCVLGFRVKSCCAFSYSVYQCTKPKYQPNIN